MSVRLVYVEVVILVECSHKITIPLLTEVDGFDMFGKT